MSTKSGTSTVRHIAVTDDEGEDINVSLWGDKAQSPVKTGHRIKLTHLSPKKFRNNIYLQSTQFTEIQVNYHFKLQNMYQYTYFLSEKTPPIRDLQTTYTCSHIFITSTPNMLHFSLVRNKNYSLLLIEVYVNFQQVHLQLFFSFTSFTELFEPITTKVTK